MSGSAVFLTQEFSVNAALSLCGSLLYLQPLTLCNMVAVKMAK